MDVPVPAGDDDSFPCDQCTLAFISFAALRRHQTSVHGYRNPLRLRITGTVCLACNKQFWTRARIVQHVAFRSRACKSFYLVNIDPVCSTECNALDLAARVNLVDSKAVPLPVMQQ